MESKEIELGPCPFCGGPASISRRESRYYGQTELGDKFVDYTYQVICSKCHARGPLYVARNVNKDIEEWRDVDMMYAKCMAMHTWNIRKDGDRIIRVGTQYRGRDCNE